MSVDDGVHRQVLRIAIVANTSWYIYNFRLNLMRALGGDGHSVVAVGGDDDYAGRLRNEGIAHRAVAFSGSGTNPWHEVRTILALRRVFATERIDVVLSYTPKGNIYSALALLRRQGSLVMNVSGLGAAFARDDLLAMIVRGLYRVSLHRAGWVFFQNDDDRSLFLARRLVDASRSSRVPGSGVDLTVFDPGLAHGAAAPQDGPLFIMVARMLWDKGVGEFVDAARQVKLRHPSARFRMLGSLAADHRGGVPEATLRGWVDEGVVEYAGSVHNVRPHLQEADCVVLPSVYREGVPRSLLEAAAMARPVITTDSVGCRDTVDHEITGFLCRPRDATDVARQMLRLLAMTPEARRRMGEAGRKKMEREFSESRVIEAYRQHVTEIADNSKGGMTP